MRLSSKRNESDGTRLISALDFDSFACHAHRSRREANQFLHEELPKQRQSGINQAVAETKAALESVISNIDSDRVQNKFSSIRLTFVLCSFDICVCVCTNSHDGESG